MGLRNADLCTHCGKMRTMHPSGLCCCCRAAYAGTCKICGAPTQPGDTYCHKCREYPSKSANPETVITIQKK